METGPAAAEPGASSQARGHLVQFYEDEEYLLKVVAAYLLTGLRAGQPALVIATESHRKALQQRLEADGIDVEHAGNGEQRLVMLDAQATLGHLLLDRFPDRERFRALVGAEITRLSTFHSLPVRAYGEMVDLLLGEGRSAAALLLEDHWNELQKTHSFSLLCAYDLRNFRTEMDASTFHEVCESHGQVAPTEGFARLDSADEQRREIAVLQQRGVALEHEIEQRKRLEQDLTEALRLRDDFVATAGHELKTPLTTLQLEIHSLLSMARQDGQGRYEAKLERSRRQMARLAKLTDELVDVSRLTAGRLRLELGECDLSAVALEMVDSAAEAIARSESSVKVTAARPVLGRWDRARLEQVVTNLLTNALRYGAGKPVEIAVTGARDRARLELRDSGIGIALEDQGRIFERFERADGARTHGGLGLGLWITRQIIAAHGGTLRVESEPGVGACFIVELPYSVKRPRG